MKTRNYLEKDDPRFWNKLLYEMPDEGLAIGTEGHGTQQNDVLDAERRHDSDGESSLSGAWEF